MAIRKLKLQQVTTKWLREDGRDWRPLADAAKIENRSYSRMVQLVWAEKRKAVNLGNQTLVIPVRKSKEKQKVANA